MNDLKEITGQVIEALKPIAQKIGQGAEAIYNMAVKDAFITGIESIFGFLFCLLMCWAWVFHGSKTLMLRVKDDDMDMIGVMGLLLGWIAFGFVSIFGFESFSNSLHYVLNPEYMALKDLLRAVKP